MAVVADGSGSRDTKYCFTKLCLISLVIVVELVVVKTSQGTG